MEDQTNMDDGGKCGSKECDVYLPHKERTVQLDPGYCSS